MTTLKDIRSSLGFTLDEVAAIAGWSKTKLNHIEASNDLDELDAERLSDLYGVSIEERLSSSNKKVEQYQPLAALLKSEAPTLDAGSRFAIAEATSVALSIQAVKKIIGEESNWQSICKFQSVTDYSHPSRGMPERLSVKARTGLKIKPGPVSSMIGDVFSRLGIFVLWEDLPSHIDAISVATPQTGAFVIANRFGDHMSSAFGRRVTWAHELCHLLYDRKRMHEMRKFCAIAYGPKKTKKLHRSNFDVEIERRARAFAVWFLAPRVEFTKAWESTSALPVDERVRHLMVLFGMGYEATRSHLDNTELLDVDAPMALVPTDTPTAWEACDPSSGLNSDAIACGVSPLRAGELFSILKRALVKDLVSEGFVREQLRISTTKWMNLRPKVLNDISGRWNTSSASIGYSL